DIQPWINSGGVNGLQRVKRGAGDGAVGGFGPTAPRADHAAGDDPYPTRGGQPVADKIKQGRLEPCGAKCTHPPVRGPCLDRLGPAHGPGPQPGGAPVDSDPVDSDPVRGHVLLLFETSKITAAISTSPLMTC